MTSSTSRLARQPLRILVAPTGFKECTDAAQVAHAMAAGAQRALPDARITQAPISDGEGFASMAIAGLGGALRTFRIRGPLGRSVEASVSFFARSGEHTAVIDIASACGLALVPADRRDPTLTTSYGVGELIIHALGAGVRRILVCCGDSGVNDGGAGMMQALGARLFDAAGQDLGPGGGTLGSLAKIDLGSLDPRLAGVRIDVAANTQTHLIGETGTTRRYGPQKGASPAQVAVLERALALYAEAIRQTTGLSVAQLPGSGASGGIVAAFLGLLGAKVHARFEIIRHLLDLDRLIAAADIVLTGEGRIDEHTAHGKSPALLAQLCRAAGKPIIAFAGHLDLAPQVPTHWGFTSCHSIVRGPCSPDHAFADAANLISDAVDRVISTVQAGVDISRVRCAASAHGSAS